MPRYFRDDISTSGRPAKFHPSGGLMTRRIWPCLHPVDCEERTASQNPTAPGSWAAQLALQVF